MKHFEALEQGGFDFIVERIHALGLEDDPGAYFARELSCQNPEVGLLPQLSAWFKQLHYTGTLEQQWRDFWSLPLPTKVPHEEDHTPLRLGAVVPGGHRRRRQGGYEKIYNVELIQKYRGRDRVVSTIPANGLALDADGIPTARYRDGIEHSFKHMPLEYRKAQL